MKLKRTHRRSRKRAYFHNNSIYDFRNPGYAKIPQIDAMQDLMLSNEGRGVPIESPLQSLFLTHENHIDGVFDLDTPADSWMDEALTRRGNKRNKLQKEAIEDALNLEASC